jgi:hypothetical protein
MPDPKSGALPLGDAPSGPKIGLRPNTDNLGRADRCATGPRWIVGSGERRDSDHPLTRHPRFSGLPFGPFPVWKPKIFRGSHLQRARPLGKKPYMPGSNPELSAAASAQPQLQSTAGFGSPTGLQDINRGLSPRAYDIFGWSMRPWESALPVPRVARTDCHGRMDHPIGTDCGAMVAERLTG